jgi:feruloyl esterase
MGEGKLMRSSILALLMVVSARVAFGATDCEALKQIQQPDLRITVAESVAPNPEWGFPPSLFNQIPFGSKGVRVPFCRVAGVIETEIGFELWLPKNWNGRFEGVGNGGLTGAINYPAMGAALTRGFATASTDTGHKTEKGFFETGWIPGHPQRVIDFAHRAHHLMAVKSKELITAHYGRSATRSYFSGCSSGGWQGLSEAQRYPGDYDGIVAGTPAINFVKLQSRGIWVGQLAVREPEGKFTPEAAQLLVSAAVSQCDGMDGLKDGLIDEPRQCNFDPASLQCRNGAADQCLTPAQVKRAKVWYGPRTSPGGMKLYPGPAVGTPPIVELLGPDAGERPGELAILLMLKQKPTWNVHSFDPDKHIPVMQKELSATLDTLNPDLTAFQKRGGKLILYHGWSDPLLSPYNTLAYFDSVT